MYKISKLNVIFVLFSLLVLFPNLFSVIFAVLGLGIPSYLFAIILSLIVLMVYLVYSDSCKLIINFRKIFIFIFFATIFFSLSYTPSVIASKNKVLFVIYNTIIPILIFELYYVFSEKKCFDLHLFEKNVLVVAYFLVWFSFFAFVIGFRENQFETRWSLKGIDNPIWFSRFIGMLLLIIIYCEDICRRKTLIYISSILMSFYLMYKGGSRGPLLGVLIVILIRLSLLVPKKKLFTYFSLIIVGLLFSFVFIKGRLFTTDTFSIMERINYTSLFTSGNLNLIVGNGIGSFGWVLYGIDDDIMYPHNIFLELLFENGIVGVIIICVVLIQFYKSFKPNIITFLVLYFFFNSLLSGDISSNNNLFILLFLSIYAKESSLSYDSRKHTR